ncbi:phage integrase family domain protein [Escherichia coli 1-250-04_S4_C1]|nr:phage integrase family domain protein [Escherichia coli 1-250-04_S4_C1]
MIGGISFHIVENMVDFRLLRSDYLSKKKMLIMLLFIPCYSD